MVDRANSLPLMQVLEDFFGLSVPRVEHGGSYKTDCPFNWEHPDGGLDKNCRIYGNTHMYCFAMHGHLNPVRLIQIKSELRPIAAANKLLQHYGLARPRPWKERYQDLVVAREQRSSPLGNTVHLVEALHLLLKQHQNFASAEFTPEFQTTFEEELERLDDMLEAGKADVEAVRHWYHGAGNRLVAMLDGEGASRGKED